MRYVLSALASVAILASSPSSAEEVIGLVGSTRIVTFDSASPGTITTSRTITGLASGVTLTGIDRIKSGNQCVATFVLIVDPPADFGNVPFRVITFATSGCHEYAGQHHSQLFGHADLAKCVHGNGPNIAVVIRCRCDDCRNLTAGTSHRKDLDQSATQSRRCCFRVVGNRLRDRSISHTN